MRSFLPSLGTAVLAAAALSGCRAQPSAPDTGAELGVCTTCHGSSGNAAPPRATNGATLTSDRAVGAHDAHLQPGPFRKAIACQECHVVPKTVDAVGHRDGVPAEVVFGALARASAATPSWDGTSCAGTYCHGSTLAGGSNTSPVWTSVDGTQTACGTCHGVPPPVASGHPAVQETTTAACARCHPDTVLADGSIDFVGSRHIDGVVQLGAAACTGCHGDSARTPAEIAAAPPRDTLGNTGVQFRGVGAHANHLSGTSLRRPIPCAECHLVPESLLAHPNATVDLSWGPVATAGGAVPAWIRATATCASTYCHGSTLRGGATTSPVWTRVDGTQVRCNSCHGAPPPLPHDQDQTCGRCHVGYTSTTVNANIHIDGYVQLDGQTCTSCHGDRTRATAIHAAPPTDVRGNVSTSALGVGAHMAHLTGTALRAPIACTECHPPVTATSHAQGRGLVVEFLWGPLATANGAQPAWDRAAARCASTYCHGSTLAGGSNTRPAWNQVNGTQAACGTCHGNPPPLPHPARADCNSCHPGFTPTDVNLATHMDGVVDAAAMLCTSCHGDATRAPATTQAAPPADTLGNRTPASRGVGAHERHLAGGALRRAMACTDCHDVPAVVNHADGAVGLTFGPLARTDGAIPTFDTRTLRCAGNYCHGATIGNTSSGPAWTVVDGTQAACGTCHGVPPPAPHSQQPACSGCHPGYTATSVDLAQHVDGVLQSLGSCTSCHGDPARAEAIAAAPPLDTAGNTATTAVGVGAHQRHLQGGAIRPAIACTECHAVPADLATHPSAAVEMTWGPLARGDGAAPAWISASASCASTYCHGATLLGGTVAAPVWTRVDGAQVACTACHGLPPPSTAHTSVAPGASCAPCHTGYTATSVNSSLHVNGVSDASGSCTSCHGDATRPAATAAAPPVDTSANTATTARGVGAHQAHLGGGSLRAGIACTECHTVPANMTAHPSSAVEMVWGPLARSASAVPSWNGTTLACSSYCHGATLSGGSDTTPTWNVVNGTQDACGTCHGVPPPAPHVQSAACGGCHGGYTATSVNLAAHVDGTIQVTAMTCTSCHGDPARALVTGADPQARSAPPVDTAGRSAATLRSVGAHLAHLNHGAGAIALPAACAECHVVPSSQTHADGTAAVAFGTRARTGNVTPTWNGTTCANTYCHGNHQWGTNSAPVWTSTARIACTACHPMPPASPSHSVSHENNNACSGCHEDTDATGSTITRPALHLNGRVDGQCLDCHDTPNP